ncbi:MAG: tripartite tricarboxylate transporter TctB family protein [Gemmobacter sp.]|nr:tripartite tricarboxylate transporter TctB family protein [Gemmobacter sp.]
MNRQVIFALLILALDAGYLLQTLSMPLPFARGEPGPSFMPLILVVALAVGALGVLVEELRGTASDNGEEGGTFGLRSIALIVVTGAFVWAFEPLGYWIATVIYTFFVAWLFEQERVGGLRAMLTSALIAVGITAVGWLFFVQLFELFLPEGIL